MTKTETETDIRDRIKSVRDLPVFLKAEFYGRSGTGKTSVAGTFPGNLLILDVRDKGTISLSNRDNIDVFEVEEFADIEEIYYFLESGDHKYKTVVIDTVTQLQELALTSIVGEDAGLITRRAWGEAASLLKSWIMLFRDLEMNVVFIAQDRITDGGDDEDDEGTLVPEVGPYMMPSVAKILNAAVDIIGQTFIREVPSGEDGLKSDTQYCLRIGPHSRYMTKLRRDPTLRTDKLPEVIVNPSYAKLLKLSTQEIKRRVKTDGRKEEAGE